MTTLLDAARGVIETRQPTVTERRDALRRLATYPDDHEPQLLSVLVGALTDLTLPRPQRQQAWDDLTEVCALLTALGTGSVEPTAIAPGAHPSCAHTVAADVLEQDIAEALARLVAGHTPEATAACQIDAGIDLYRRMIQPVSVTA